MKVSTLISLLLFQARLDGATGNDIRELKRPDRWWETISPAPTETAIPSPSPSAVPTETSGPTITGKPSVGLPSATPTESPAPSPSPSDVPTPSPSSSPTAAPSSSPSHAPTATPTISSSPTIAPTATPTVGAKTKSTELTIFLEGVSGTLSLKSANAFNSIAKEVLQNTLIPSDGNVSFEFIYVQIINQEFIEGGGEDRRALEEETLGSLKLDLKIVASVLPGDYDGFDEDVGGFFVNSANTDVLDAELRKEADFYDFVPVSVVDGDGTSIDDGSVFSGNVVIGIIFGSAGVMGLFYVYYGRKRGRMGSLEKKNSAGSSTDEEIGASASEESIEVQYPKETNPTSPGNESKTSKFTGFSTGAMCNGAGNFQLRNSSIPKSFFFSRKGDIETDVCQPTMCQPKMLQSSSTDSGLFDIARKCGAPPMTKVRSNDTDVGIFMTDSIVEKESFVHEEMTAIEAILE